MIDHKDGGYKSRKLVLSYVSLLMILVGFLLTGKYPALAVSYAEYCMGILAAASIYAGANTAVKWLSTKSKKSVQPPVKDKIADKASDEPPADKK